MSATEQSKSRLIETNGINVINAADRHGGPRTLVWPWAAASLSVLIIPIGAQALNIGGGLSLWQLILVTVLGVAGSGLVCGIIAIAGKRSGTPTLVASRAAFGVIGNWIPGCIAWLGSIGWSVLMVVAATVATASTFSNIGFGNYTLVSILTIVVVAALVLGASVLGFDIILRIHMWLTIVLAIMTVMYFVMIVPQIVAASVTPIPAGSISAVIGATMFVFAATGIGWATSAADYSRYVPKDASSRAVAGWTATGLALAPIVLIVFGAVLATAGDPDFYTNLVSDPIGTLAQFLPLWFIAPFVAVAVLALVAGAILKLYSSGLTLLTLGVKTPRSVVTGISGFLVVALSVYFVYFCSATPKVFTGLVITLGVPLAAWAGIMMTDVLIRRKRYDEYSLFHGNGMYKRVRLRTLVILAAATALGYGLVSTDTVAWRRWQGFLLHPLGLGGHDGAIAATNLGVGVAFVLAAALYLVCCRHTVVGQDVLVSTKPVPETGKLPDFLKAQADYLAAQDTKQRD